MQVPTPPMVGGSPRGADALPSLQVPMFNDSGESPRSRVSEGRIAAAAALQTLASGATISAEHAMAADGDTGQTSAGQNAATSTAAAPYGLSAEDLDEVTQGAQALMQAVARQSGSPELKQAAFEEHRPPHASPAGARDSSGMHESGAALDSSTQAIERPIPTGSAAPEAADASGAVKVGEWLAQTTTSGHRSPAVEPSSELTPTETERNANGEAEGARSSPGTEHSTSSESALTALSDGGKSHGSRVESRDDDGDGERAHNGAEQHETSQYARAYDEGSLFGRTSTHGGRSSESSFPEAGSSRTSGMRARAVRSARGNAQVRAAPMPMSGKYIKRAGARALDEQEAGSGDLHRNHHQHTPANAVSESELSSEEEFRPAQKAIKKGSASKSNPRRSGERTRRSRDSPGSDVEMEDPSRRPSSVAAQKLLATETQREAQVRDRVRALGEKFQAYQKEFDENCVQLRAIQLRLTQEHGKLRHALAENLYASPGIDLGKIQHGSLSPLGALIDEDLEEPPQQEAGAFEDVLRRLIGPPEEDEVQRQLDDFAQRQKRLQLLMRNVAEEATEAWDELG